jgi:hypothetical protein
METRGNEPTNHGSIQESVPQTKHKKGPLSEHTGRLFFNLIIVSVWKHERDDDDGRSNTIGTSIRTAAADANNKIDHNNQGRKTNITFLNII